MIQESEPEVHGGLSFTPGPMASSSKDKVPNASSLDPKTEAIYAFRTISTMLLLIHSARIRTTRPPTKGSHQRELLQLLDALAAVLVRTHGVFAVTAQPYDDSGKVEVLTSYMDNRESSLTHTISQPEFALQFLRNVFISQNPRNFSVKVPTVVDPVTSVPDNFKVIKDPTKLLNTFLLEKW